MSFSIAQRKRNARNFDRTMHVLTIMASLDNYYEFAFESEIVPKATF